MIEVIKIAEKIGAEMNDYINKRCPPGSYVTVKISVAMDFLFIKIAEQQIEIERLAGIAKAGDCDGQNCHACANPCGKYEEDGQC